MIITRNTLPLALLATIVSAPAHATLDSPEIFRPFPSFLLQPSASAALPAPEAFSRAQAVLQHFGVPAEEDPQPALQALQGLQSEAGLRELLPKLDPGGWFSRMATIDAAMGQLTFFQDDRAKTLPDFSLSLLPEGSLIPEAPFQRRLQDARRNSPQRPLAGLRIAIDPGHMGGKAWDQRTGKYVRDRAGRILSEGELALIAALLLEKDLRTLGADVLLTRRALVPVTTIDYDSYDSQPFALNELRESRLEPWFQKLLKTAPPGPKLYQAFSKSPSFRELFSNNERDKYFIQRADLQARVDMIEAFDPDLTLVIHFDTLNGPTGLDMDVTGYNGTKAYVAGAFQPEELPSRADRQRFASVLFQPAAWQGSVRFSQAVVEQIRAKLGVPYDTSGGGGAIVPVAPGVFARNLYLTSRLTRSPLCYIESLFYSNTQEFQALSRKTRTLVEGGVSYAYSDRLALLAAAYRDGILAYVRDNAR